MGSQDSLTHRWLRHNIQSYPAHDIVFAHSDAVLARYPTVRPKTDVYTYDDGRTQLLLCLHGLLPIAYRGASYNIPIAIWLTREYPRQPPIAYVVPTTDMIVRPGPDMDVSGRCQLEYLRNWQRKSEGCNLAALIQAMQDSFSRVPPVNAKPAGVPSSSAMQRSQTTSPEYSARPPPPLPGAQARSHTASPPSAVTQTDGRPPLPARPAHSAVIPVQISSSSTIPPSSPPPNNDRSDSPNVLANASLGMRPPPPLPPHPPAYSLPVSPAGDPRLGTSPPPLPPPFVSPQLSTGFPPHQPRPAPPAPPPPAALTPAFSVSPPPPRAPVPSVIPPDLLDGDEPAQARPSTPPSAAPPRPPNPELLRLHAQVHAKLQSELASLQHAMALDAERLRAHQADLLAGEPAIRDEMARLEAVRSVCGAVAERMRVVVDAGERNVAELRRKGDPEVDELVCSTTIVHNQLVNLVAEDNAIEDTIYHLHRALNTGRIDLERFIRTTRVLAEEQFMKRALIEKIETGLPPDDAELAWTMASEWR
ncbi:hypothetical protein IEO21_01650 [Rhodonia placenta]|uniref:UEV-domain-containing protein n=1 Tax=Rhodonia placenta TaxID=104341 RepID=A0A8H7U5C9_9APHY|nr:hypothetical protein IEO21_01650 [Postia placenta]